MIPGRPRPGQMMQALYYDRDAYQVSRERWRQLLAPDPPVPAQPYPGADQRR